MQIDALLPSINGVSKVALSDTQRTYLFALSWMDDRLPLRLCLSDIGEGRVADTQA